VNTFSVVLAVVLAFIFIAVSSAIKEPNRRNFMAIMIGGAGAACLSGGGLGKWEFVFHGRGDVLRLPWASLVSFHWAGLDFAHDLGSRAPFQRASNHSVCC
jgi:hypothetical protein